MILKKFAAETMSESQQECDGPAELSKRVSAESLPRPSTESRACKPRCSFVVSDVSSGCFGDRAGGSADHEFGILQRFLGCGGGCPAADLVDQQGDRGPGHRLDRLAQRGERRIRVVHERR